ncbi:MAG: hypothetical protein J6A29_02625 [Clostridia bacterium]|nr:hypothetical protein [Clostridia bacterium]
MENATKALLIAAAVLIAIVLIAVSIKILSSTSGVTEQVDSVSNAMAASVFNSQYLPFVSNSTTGSQAKALTYKIMSNNSTVSSASRFSADKHQIYLNYDLKSTTGVEYPHKWKQSDLQTIYDMISNTANYKITVTNCGIYSGGYYKGYIVCMTIKEI